MSEWIVVVQFDSADRSAEGVIEGSRRSHQKFRGLDGLHRKDYVLNESGAAGIYRWASREAAEAWYTDAKIDELEKTYGVRPTLTWYEIVATVDNDAGTTIIDGQELIET